MIGWLTKKLTSMRHAGLPPALVRLLARTKFDYAKEIGDGLDASVVMAPVQWIQRAFPDAPLTVYRRRPEHEKVEGHDLARLVARPNPAYGDLALWSATLLSYLIAGNAYWHKVRNGAGRVVELWYAPHWTMTPKWPADGSAFVSHYEYRPGGTEIIRLDPADVVHFRHGIDPRNIRLGISPIHSTIREIFMDLESSNFVSALLRNLGVPGLVISPDGAAQVGPDDVEAVKKWLRQNFGGDRRGEPLVLGAPTRVAQFGFDPKAMDLSVARDVAEERVCAVLGIPAAIVGFGAGLQQTKVGATMEELSRLAWTNGIIPIQRGLADEMSRSLLPDFERRPDDFEVGFDASELIVLEADMAQRATRWNTMVAGGWALVAEAREAMGLDTDETHRIYLRPISVFEVPAGQAPRQPAAPEEGGEAAAEPGGEKDDKARAERTIAMVRYVTALDRLTANLSAAMQRPLERVFEDLGRAAADAARPLIEEDRAQRGEAAAEPGGTKADPPSGEDQVLAGRIMEQLELPLHQTAFKRVYEAHYLEVARNVAQAGELLGLATDLPDPVARAVVAAGGRRAGLVDLAQQSRLALFDSLAEGRAAGEGVDQLVARIQSQVEAGPWASRETRARTIARTETKYAQNVSTMARARHEGVERFVVFDGRLGPGRSTPSHIARDGSIVTAAEAETMAAEEHPNGTLSFAPYFENEE